MLADFNIGDLFHMFAGRKKHTLGPGFQNNKVISTPATHGDGPYEHYLEDFSSHVYDNTAFEIKELFSIFSKIKICRGYERYLLWRKRQRLYMAFPKVRIYIFELFWVLRQALTVIPKASPLKTTYTPSL